MWAAHVCVIKNMYVPKNVRFTVGMLLGPQMQSWLGAPLRLDLGFAVAKGSTASGLGILGFCHPEPGAFCSADRGSVQTHTHTNRYVCMDLCICVYMYIDICLYIHMYIVYMHMCVYVYIFTYV